MTATPNKTAETFVRISLELYAQEGRFRIAVLDRDDLEPYAEEFRRRGCLVIVDRTRDELIVQV